MTLFFSSVDFCQLKEVVYKNIDSTYRFQGIVPPIEFKYNINEILSEPLYTGLPDEVVNQKNFPAMKSILISLHLCISNI
ncbi:MAG: hypothetical protein P8X47_06525 [Ignavibacteriaceae bacterium]